LAQYKYHKLNVKSGNIGYRFPENTYLMAYPTPDNTHPTPEYAFPEIAGNDAELLRTF
jgi:hypothetical protein